MSRPRSDRPTGDGVSDFVDAFGESMRGLGYRTGRFAPTMTTAEKTVAAREIATREGVTYRTARRRVERATTRAGQARGQPQRQFAEQVRRRGLYASATIWLDPSPDPRRGPRCRPRRIGEVMEADDMPATLRHLRNADLDSAGEAFLIELLRQYMDRSADQDSLLDGAYICDITDFNIAFGSGGE